MPGHSSMPAYHCSSSSSAPRNRSSPAIRKVPRQMAAVKMRTRNQRPRLLTVLRSRRVIRLRLSWTAKLIPRSMCLSRDGSSWHSPFPSFCPKIIGYYGTWNCTCRETLTASEWKPRSDSGSIIAERNVKKQLLSDHSKGKLRRKVSKR
jgi:hypothetical protein